MPTITLNKRVLESLMGKRIPPAQLQERISSLGVALEKIEGNEILLEVFPNRPDLLSEQGFARALSSFLGIRPGLREYPVTPSKHIVIISPSVAAVRPYTACALVQGLRLDDERIAEIIRIQEKLHGSYGRDRKRVAIGIYPFERITPPITFQALPPDEIRFRPLDFSHAITGREILAQHPAGRAYGSLLAGAEKYPVFTDAKGNVLSMPPIINSHETGRIDAETTDVFVECSGFQYPVLQACLNIIVAALADMGGRIHSLEMHYGKTKRISPDFTPRNVPLSLDYVNARLGLRLSEQDIPRLLAAMGHGYQKRSALVPAYRADILHQIDLVEDIAIAYGYGNLPPQAPLGATVGSEDPFSRFQAKLAELLTGLGLLEVNTYHLISAAAQQGMMCSSIPVVLLHNPSSKEYDSLRAWMLPSLLDVLARNTHHEYPQNLFDLGTAFRRGPTDTGVTEHQHLAVVLCGERANFTAIRQVMDYLLRMLGVGYQVRAMEHTSFIPGRVGEIYAAKTALGQMGEVHPQVLANFKLEMPVAGLEIDVSGLFSLLQK
ncbi:MAG TPA: phenylalanine--tRNA ligase subunit beta [Candidatus Nanoarchaeia archaeon]|nr:phenylalanine--tRNA ligase subunit beta [Candidatus Nanoarchaeia archaeon]